MEQKNGAATASTILGIVSLVIAVIGGITFGVIGAAFPRAAFRGAYEFSFVWYFILPYEEKEFEKWTVDGNLFDLLFHCQIFVRDASRG